MPLLDVSYLRTSPCPSCCPPRQCSDHRLTSAMAMTRTDPKTALFDVAHKSRYYAGLIQQLHVQNHRAFLYSPSQYHFGMYANHRATDIFPETPHGGDHQSYFHHFRYMSKSRSMHTSSAAAAVTTLPRHEYCNRTVAAPYL